MEWRWVTEESFDSPGGEVEWSGGPIGGRPDTRSNMPRKGDMKSLDMTSTVKPPVHLIDAHLKEIQ